MKTYLALFIMLFTFYGAFAQDSKKGAVDKIREIAISEDVSLNSIIGIKSDFVLEDYQITLANKGKDEIFIWRKGTFPEDRLVEMIQDNREGDNSVLYIENVKYSTSSSNEIITLKDPVKVRIQ